MIIVIGAGISGLTIAKNLSPDKNCLILEKEKYAGGLATQYYSDGYWFDFGGHYFHFLNKPEIKEYLFKYCRFKEIVRKSRTFLMGRYIPFPVQFHLSFLPAHIRKAILKEILEGGQKKSENLRDFLICHFGDTLYHLFFEPFLTKYYQIELEMVATGMERGSIPIPDKDQVIIGEQGGTFSKTGYNPVFYYPASSMRYFFKQYVHSIRNQIHFNQEIIEIDLRKKYVKTNEATYFYDKLVSTMPLNKLLDIIKPVEQLPSSRELRYISTLLVNAVLKQKRKKLHWVYLPEKKFPFYRFGYYPVHSHPACYLERSIKPGFVPDMNSLKQEILYTLKELKIITNNDELLYFNSKIIPVSYVIFTKNWKKIVPPVLEKLRENSIYSIGRFGSWHYSSMSDDVKSAVQVAREI